MVMIKSFVAAALFASTTVVAHPGHDVREEAAERAEFFKRNPRSVRSCAQQMKARGFDSSSFERREALANAARVKRGLPTKPFLSRRDLSDYEFSHKYTGGDISIGSDENTLFADNSSCTLQTEVTQGPYFVNGEQIRQDVTEDQEGVPLLLDVQIIDTSTCDPVSAMYFDIWHCNSTGVYSGVSASGNGNSDDATNIDNTFLRGIQQTDANGVVQFDTLVPGHYVGRAPHIHILAHNKEDTTVRVNGTLLSGTNNTIAKSSHVGQLFFDQSLITQVEKTSPYSSNTQDLTLNSDDSILSQEADTTDPFVEYVLLGDTVEDGIMAWISIGIDPTASDDISDAVTYYETGGVENPDSGMGGGGPPPSGSGSMPAPTSTSTA